MSRRPYRDAAFAAALFLAAPAFTADSTEGPSMPESSKATRSVAERKLDTPLRLLLEGRGSDGTPTRSVAATTNDDPLTVQIDGTVSPALADAVAAAHGTVIEQSSRWGVTRAVLPLSSVLAIAARPDVRRVRLPPRARLNRVAP